MWEPEEAPSNKLTSTGSSSSCSAENNTRLCSIISSSNNIFVYNKKKIDYGSVLVRGDDDVGTK